MPFGSPRVSAIGALPPAIMTSAASCSNNEHLFA
jgi:hypothetical protein